MNFKYKTTFSTKASLIQKSNGFLTKASLPELKELRSLIPDQAQIDENPDLLYCSANLFVANQINLNGAGVSTETAIKLANQLKNKYLNIEHQKSYVVGFINSVGYTSFPDNKIITKEEVEKAEGFFNVAIGGTIWKVVDPFFASYLKEASNPDDYFARDISLSWEVGFNDYGIVIGSKNISKARVVTEHH